MNRSGWSARQAAVARSRGGLFFFETAAGLFSSGTAVAGQVRYLIGRTA